MDRNTNRRMFLLFSHKLTEDQIADAKNSWDIDEVVSLPEDLQNIWSQVDPYYDDERSRLREIIDFVNKNGQSGDVVLIQGEWGYVYDSVISLKKSGFIPVYSTTKRMVEEVHLEDGNVKKISNFKHIKYRRY